MSDSAPPCVLFVAGEASGDQIAARAASALRARGGRTRILAVGGPALREAPGRGRTGAA